MKLAREHLSGYTAAIHQEATRETLASATKTDAFKRAWDSRTRYEWRDGWGCCGGVVGGDVCWSLGGTSTDGGGGDCRGGG